MKNYSFTIDLTVDKNKFQPLLSLLKSRIEIFLVIFLSIVSLTCFVIFYQNGLGLSYNDARSHLDIGRRVVEGLKPGLAQLGSVWLPLPHILMIPTIWNDFMWHSGLSGALPSMISFVFTGVIIYLFLVEIGASWWGRIVGVLVYATNLNMLYLQSTAMTESLLLATMMAGSYELLLWIKKSQLINLILASFFIMLATLIRYDGWFLLLYGVGVIVFNKLRMKKHKIKTMEGTLVIFLTLAGVGIAAWFLWNAVIFNDAVYFLFGPYSAYAQQKLLDGAGNLATKGNIGLSIKYYFFALFYNTDTIFTVLGFVGAILIWFNKRISWGIKIAVSVLFSPLLFNIIALYQGHSVLYIQGLSGNTWFNVRYGIMMVPSFAILTGYLIHRASKLRHTLVGLIILVLFFSWYSGDSVTVDHAREGASQKNVTEVSGWLKENSGKESGYIMISAASHDAIIFSSGLPMSRFIHEGTGDYWDSAIANPSHLARWIIMRTNDLTDLTFRELHNNSEFANYNLVGKYPFADIYELKSEYLGQLKTSPVVARSN